MYLSVSFLISLYMGSEHCGQLKTRSHAEVRRSPRCLRRCAHRRIMKRFMQPPRFKGHAGDSRRRMKTTFWLNQRRNLFSVFFLPSSTVLLLQLISLHLPPPLVSFQPLASTSRPVTIITGWAYRRIYENGLILARRPASVHFFF